MLSCALSQSWTLGSFLFLFETGSYVSLAGLEITNVDEGEPELVTLLTAS